MKYQRSYPLVRMKNGIVQVGRRVEVDRRPDVSDLFIEWEDVPTVAADAPDREPIGGTSGKPQGAGG